MARTYAKWLTSVTSDEHFLAMSMSAKFLYSMLVAMPKLSSAGSIDYRPRRWCELDATFTPDAIRDAVDELAANRYLHVDEETEEVLLRSFIRIDGGFKNTNMRKAIQSAIDTIESERLRAIATVELARATGQVTDPDEPPSGHHAEGASEPTGSLQPSPTTVHPSAASTVTSENRSEAYRRAVDAAVDIRRSKAGKILHPDTWEPKTREGLERDFGAKLRRYADEGHDPVDAARIALGYIDPFPPRRPKVEPHSDACQCDGIGFLYLDENDFSKGVMPCPGTNVIDIRRPA